jgi:hypothetical protein
MSNGLHTVTEITPAISPEIKSLMRYFCFISNYFHKLSIFIKNYTVIMLKLVINKLCTHIILIPKTTYNTKIKKIIKIQKKIKYE